MILVFYGLWLLGVVLLVLDISGRFRVPARRASVLKVIGLAALAIPALVPLAAVYGHWWEWSGVIFPIVAHAYPVLAGVYLVAIAVGKGMKMRLLSRVAYVGLLALAAIPSFVLLPIAGPTVGLAGLALARRSPVHEAA
ncbi:hypothetical protein BH24CHL5_BH24CHL5_12500 [soil metagenome]